MTEANPTVPGTRRAGADVAPGTSAGQAAGRRAILNTAFQATGELLGKLGTFVVFAVMTRELGAAAVGAYVVAFAYVQIMMIGVNIGLDRALLRSVALDVRSLPGSITNVVGIKFALSVPVTVIGWVTAWLVGYDSLTRIAIAWLTLGLLLDSINASLAAALNGRERGGLLSISVMTNRLVSGALGIIALLLGYGIIAVAATYAVGSALGILVCLRLLAKHVGPVRGRVRRDRWPEVVRVSLPFALYASFGFLFSRVDAIVLSALADQATIGLYGAASRVYEASTFVTFSISASFSAMFTYLGRDTDPTLGAVFERGIKLSLVLLLPLAVGFGLAAENLSAVLFGEDFRATGDSLRLLAPAIALLGIMNLCATLLALRIAPRVLLTLTGSGLALNAVLCLILVPSLGGPGAALAMSASLGALSVGGLALSAREVGGVHLGRMFTAPVVAALAMAATMQLVHDTAPALASGATAYAVAYVGVERFVAPQELQFIAAMLRRSIRR